MEKDEMPEELLEAAGGEGEALSNADKRKFAEEQYERALKETEAQGEARRKSVADAVALCAATVAPPDAEDVLVKWTGLGYDEASRERWSDVLEACADREDLDARVVACARRFASKPTRTQASARAAQDKASVKAVKRAVPLAPYRGGPLHLRPYQIDGVAWLAFNYLQKRSSILADEMGLGKTVQTVSLVRMAKERYGAQGPALIVAPLSTLAHWQREFEHWSALDVMVYHGSQASRLEARNLDLMARKTAAKKNPKVKTPKTPSVDVVVTTYEQLLLEDSANALGAISWSLLVVDEAHRLKNPHSRLYRTLHGDNGTFKAISRLLLTGTPLQNNMTELWSLLSFCDEERFGDDPDEFVEKYAFVCGVLDTV
jgi:chromodomain-helicase-DNA-binding protein 7